MPTAPTVTDQKTAAVTFNTSVTCDMPSNTSSHVLIACVSAWVFPKTPAISFTVSGWTSINSISITSDVNNCILLTEVFRHAGGLTSPISATVSRGTCDNLAIVVLAIDGASTSAPIDISGTAGGYGYTSTMPSVTTTKANDLVLFWGSANDSSISIYTIDLNYSSEVQAVAGATGARSSTGTYPTTHTNIVVAIAPFEGPTIPNLTFPNGGESLTAGATTSITWTPSTSPTAAQSSLQYNLDYSVNNGANWTSIVALTSAGATSYAWTVPSTTGSGYLVRIRAYDPAITTYSLGYDQSNAAFSVVAETTPGQPVITAPASGSANNKAVNVTVAWVHQGGVGNPQTEFTLQWATNSGFSGATTVGPTTTSTQSTSIDFSAQASGTTIYVKVKTKGLSLYSAYSNTVSFIVASLPATPNITAPTNASPPTVPNPTVTFTEADAFVARKMRVTVAGIETYNSGTVVSTATSFTSPYSFANGIQVVLYLSVQNVYGLWSAEDSETLTPAYTGPATPTITLTANSDAGYIAIAITNSDTPSYNEVWRRQLGQPASDAIQISPSSVAVDGTFTDYGVRSGITYVYFARAVNSGTTLYSTSAEAQASITLKQLVISLPTATGGLSTANALSAVSVINFAAGPRLKQQAVGSIKLLGRTSPVPILGETIGGSLAQQIVIPMSQNSLYTSTMAILESGDVICVRDQFGNKIFGKVGQITVTDQNTYWLINFTITDDYHNESATGLDTIPAAVSGFVPVDVPSCTLWLEADNIVGVADGGTVSSWPDISGSNNHATQSTGSKQPILRTDWINGQPVVKFDGIDDTLTTASALWTGTQSRGLIAVYRQSVSSGTNRIVCGQSTTNTSGSTFELAFSSAGSSNPRLQTPLSTVTNLLSGLDDLHVGVCCITFDGSVSTLYWGGRSVGGTSALALNTTSAVFRIGSRLDTGVESRFWDGEIMAIAAFSIVPTFDQIGALMNMWLAKYGGRRV